MAIFVLFIVAYWRMFEKAGQAGWAALTPISTLYVLPKVAGRPGWWLLRWVVVPVLGLCSSTYSGARLLSPG